MSPKPIKVAGTRRNSAEYIKRNSQYKLSDEFMFNSESEEILFNMERIEKAGKSGRGEHPMPPALDNDVRRSAHRSPA